MRHVTILGLDRCLASSITLPTEMLNAASEMAIASGINRKRIHIDIASDESLITTAGGLTLNSTIKPATIIDTDLLILPALWRSPHRTLNQYQHLLPWIQTIANTGTIICAVGSSSCFLAEANLLKNKPATTHWLYHDEFMKRYPSVNFKRQYLITQAGNIFCAGSVNSVADLMVHLASKFYGNAIAKKVEGHFSPEIRRSFDSHAYADNDTGLHHDEVIIDAQEWLLTNISEPIVLANLAENLGLSIRSFSRRFKLAVGITAGEYLQNLRLNNAKELLRTSNLSVAEIGERCGYQDNSYFCARFKKIMGQTPFAYRKSVRGKLFKVV